MQIRYVPDWTLIVAVMALSLSFFNFYYQHLRRKLARVRLINAGETQDTIPRPYNRLPDSLAYDFPEYACPGPLYATVRLIFANTGDRPGYAKLDDVNVRWAENDTVTELQHALECYNYTYALLPPHSVVDHVIMLRNIPLTHKDKAVRVRIAVRFGGERGTIEESRDTDNYILNVRLTPAGDTDIVTQLA